MKPTITINDDYAVLTCKNARFYYGYEEVDSLVEEGSDEQAEWCFTAEIEGHPKIKIPFSKLKGDARDESDVVSCLMMGIGWVLTKYEIKVG